MVNGKINEGITLGSWIYDTEDLPLGYPSH